MAEPHEGDDAVQQAVRRQTGIAALRKLRQLVDEEAVQAQWNARWARRLGGGFLLAALALIIWLMLRAGH